MNQQIFRRDVCDWINGVTSLESRIIFDVDGTCRVYSGEIECSIEVPEEMPVIIFYIPITKVSVEHREKQMEHALTLNLLQIKTGRASVAYDPKVERIVLNQIFQADEMTEEVFHNALLNLIDIASNMVTSFEELDMKCDELDMKSEVDTQMVDLQIRQENLQNFETNTKLRV